MTSHRLKVLSAPQSQWHPCRVHYNATVVSSLPATASPLRLLFIYHAHPHTTPRTPPTPRVPRNTQWWSFRCVPTTRQASTPPTNSGGRLPMLCRSVISSPCLMQPTRALPPGISRETHLLCVSLSLEALNYSWHSRFQRILLFTVQFVRVDGVSLFGGCVTVWWVCLCLVGVSVLWVCLCLVGVSLSSGCVSVWWVCHCLVGMSMPGGCVTVWWACLCLVGVSLSGGRVSVLWVCLCLVGVSLSGECVYARWVSHCLMGVSMCLFPLR